MGQETVARNYAETLLVLATKAQNRDGFGSMMQSVANAMTGDPTVRLYLESPRVSAEEKSLLLAQALGDRMPRLFVRYLQSVVQHRRQMLIPAIAAEYADLVDAAEGRVHADVSVARPLDDAGSDRIAEQLSRALGKRVVPRVTVRPELLGGVVVRVGDRVMDGSVRRRLAILAQRMRVPA